MHTLQESLGFFQVHHIRKPALKFTKMALRVLKDLIFDEELGDLLQHLLLRVVRLNGLSVLATPTTIFYILGAKYHLQFSLLSVTFFFEVTQ